MFIREAYRMPPSEAVSPSAGFFTTQGAFVPSPEGQKILDFYRDKHQIPLEIRPVPPEELKANAGVGGYFRTVGADKQGYGGSFDPERRIVFLNPESATSSVLAHEGYHAYDPVLPRSQQHTSIGREAYGNKLIDAALNKSVQDPGAYLETYLTQTGPSEVFQVESRTQRGAKDVLSNLGISHPEAERAWYAGYPKSSISKGISSVADLLTIPRGPQQFESAFIGSAIQGAGNPSPGGTINSYGGDVSYDYGKAKALELLDLYLNPAFTKTADKVRNRADIYADRVIYSDK